ncbi:uncharacterized protein BCR38DRAFT_122904 [Pseudomassariella vexata]|uniref:Uncharacterized protein n=1 Tax=Pseudomassariella vexata TaxID=1141098 RepID=A0A1Y2D8P8_9PEZI|nr:uncharacterized protein BCR38DRAFT_122904 [Pseudomassariella vexata]ORY55643.1 hypothetical protein BCR38DRAFT_122904 [Pseudomassariella vexata]
MSSSRSGRSGGSGHHGSRGGKKGRSSQSSTQQLIESLQTHRVNVLTELCRIERVAASCDNEENSRAFQGPMTSAWDYYVNSNQLLTELRGLTPNYPIVSELVNEAHRLVRNDPESNRSWNLAWLCLTKIQDNGLISVYATSESWRKEMWGGRDPSQEEADQLAQCFEYEWAQAVANMLRHWSVAPTWY